jgi:hypothetical protein
MSLDLPAFGPTEEHRDLRAAVRALADDKIAPRAAEVDESGEFPWDVHDALARAELTAGHIPEAYGGSGADAIVTAIVIEEVARACAPGAAPAAVSSFIMNLRTQLMADRRHRGHGGSPWRPATGDAAAILATVGVVAAAYMAGKLLYRLRDVLLLMAVSGFVALLLNPLVVYLQRWKVPRRGYAVAIVIFWAVLVFAVLAVAFGYPLVNAVTHLADRLPSYVDQAQHGKGWIVQVIRHYHVQTWVQHNASKVASLAQGLAPPSLRQGACHARFADHSLFLVVFLLLEGPKVRLIWAT